MSRKKSISFTSRPGARTQTVATDRGYGCGNVDDIVNMDVIDSVHRVSHVPGPGDRPGGGAPSCSSGLLGKALYGTAYGVSYGVVFSVLILGMLVPGRRIIGKAMTDATASAKRTFYGTSKNPDNLEPDGIPAMTPGNAPSVVGKATMAA